MYARGDNLPMLDSRIALGRKALLEMAKQKPFDTSIRLKSKWICDIISHAGCESMLSTVFKCFTRCLLMASLASSLFK